MQIVEILSLSIFILTYLLIAVNKTPWFEIKRSYAALAGGVLMVVVGALTLNDAFESIDFKVISLLLGMMTLVAGLEYTGFFTLISDLLLKRSKGGATLLMLIMAASAILSAIALNDAVVLMFTPIVIRCCHKVRMNPIPYLVGMMMSANIGSIATAVGNPQNAYIVSFEGVSFTEFSLYSIPIAVACLFVTYLILFFLFKNKMQQSKETVLEDEQSIPIDRMRLSAMIVILCLTFIGFTLTGIFDFELYQVALFSGIFSLAVIMTSSAKDIVWTAKRIDWHILLFFIGLFILIGGASNSGLIADMTSYVPGFRDGETPDALSLSAFSVILSNLVSNVPAVMLIERMMTSPDLMLSIVLAASSTLAGNTTLLGSAANIIVAERSEKYGIRIDFFRFMIAGIIVTIATVAIMLLCVTIMFN